MKKVKTISRIILVIYVAIVSLICFVHIEGSMDMSKTWLGIPMDKVIHFIMFLPFTPIVYHAFYQSGRRPARLVLFFVVTIIAGGILAGTTEIIQGYLKYRSADIGDFRADCTGILVGTVITTAVAAFHKNEK